MQTVRNGTKMSLLQPLWSRMLYSRTTQGVIRTQVGPISFTASNENIRFAAASISCCDGGDPLTSIWGRTPWNQAPVNSFLFVCLFVVQNHAMSSCRDDVRDDVTSQTPIANKTKWDTQEACMVSVVNQEFHSANIFWRNPPSLPPISPLDATFPFPWPRILGL